MGTPHKRTGNDVDSVTGIGENLTGSLGARAVLVVCSFIEIRAFRKRRWPLVRSVQMAPQMAPLLPMERRLPVETSVTRTLKGRREKLRRKEKSLESSLLPSVNLSFQRVCNRASPAPRVGSELLGEAVASGRLSPLSPDLRPSPERLLHSPLPHSSSLYNEETQFSLCMIC